MKVLVLGVWIGGLSKFFNYGVDFRGFDKGEVD